MFWRTMALMAAVACTGGCAKDPKAQALEACAEAVAQKLVGKEYRLDRTAMQASAADDGTGVIAMSGGLLVNPGMTNEEKQSVQCKARVENGKADVVSLSIIW